MVIPTPVGMGNVDGLHLKSIDFWREKHQAAKKRYQEVFHRLRRAEDLLNSLRKNPVGSASLLERRGVWETKVAKLRKDAKKAQRRMLFSEERIEAAQSKSRYVRILKTPPV
jgi:hypothetical protein